MTPASDPPATEPGAGTASRFPQVPPPPPGVAVLGGRLHPSAIAVWSWGQLGALALLLLVNPQAVPMVVVLLGVFAAVNGVRYARFRWRLDDRQLVIEQGLLERKRRVIPLERVQSVDLVRRIPHRVFGTVAVQVEAIGSGDTEGRLDAVDPDTARRLRGLLLERRRGASGQDAAPGAADGDATVGGEATVGGDGPAAAQRGEPGAGSPVPDGAAAGTGELLAAVSPRQLVVAGLTEANVTLLAAVGGLIWQVLGDRLDEFAERLPRLLGAEALPVVAVLAVLTALVLLVGAQLVLHWEFTLHRAAGTLVVRRGLLEQRYDTIPLRRIQALRIEENLPRRLLGLAAIRADVAGKPGGGSGGTDTLLPIGQAGQARALVAAILDHPGAGEIVLAGMPPGARARRRVRAVVATVALTALAVVVWGPGGLAVGLTVVPLLAIAEASYRALGHAEVPGLVVTRGGWWVRRTAFVPDDRLHAVESEATLLQRRRRLATVRLGIPRSPGLWSGPQMVDLEQEVAGAVLEDLARLAAARR